MFTGIITDLGTIKSIKTDDYCCLAIQCNDDTMSQLKLGSSIACSGVCLTVTSMNDNIFTVQVSQETLNKTTIKYYKVNDRINLENSLKIGDEISGHLVYGHVDGIGNIYDIISDKHNLRFVFETEPYIMEYIIFKGSITIDGVSLTVNQVFESKFEVTIIPHTYQNTIFQYKKPKDQVNLEIDIIARYAVSNMKKIKLT